MKKVTRRTVAVSVLTAAMGIALTAAAPSRAAENVDMSKMPKVVQDNMARMMSQKLQKCYGINAAAKNDCAEGAHSCAGQGGARDAKSFVLLPAGDCEKIAGGKLTAS
ncbi:MAG: DUF2282 domain-containing protein [Nitrospiraceae bacterium]